jgi:hypothetical protein
MRSLPALVGSIAFTGRWAATTKIDDDDVKKRRERERSEPLPDRHRRDDGQGTRVEERPDHQPERPEGEHARHS